MNDGVVKNMDSRNIYIIAHCVKSSCGTEPRYSISTNALSDFITLSDSMTVDSRFFLGLSMLK